MLPYFVRYIQRIVGGGRISQVYTPTKRFCLGTEVPRHSAGCVGMYVAFRNVPAQVHQPA